MARLLFALLILLISLAIARGQETHSTETVEHEAPCAVHPLNGRICVSDRILYNLLLRRVAPKIPDMPNANSEVVLHLVIGKNGRPARISVISGDPALARSVVRAVKKWLFKPYIYNGEYVEMESDVHLRFPDPN